MECPNLFIVGAPRCGTTSLWNYLRPRPEIRSGLTKEPHYFAGDVRGRPPLSSWSEYVASFEPDRGEGWWLDASVGYLYSARASQRIAELSPDARMLVMIRDPVELMRSMHARDVLSGFEREPDFERVLERQESNAPANDSRGRLTYMRLGAYAADVCRYLESFVATKVIVFDDFVSDTPLMFADVLDFLGLPPGVMPEFEQRHRNVTPRSRVVSRYVLGGATARRFARVVPRGTREQAWRRISRLNSRPTTRAPLADELRRRLFEVFRPSLVELGARLDRDLVSLWSPDTT